MNPTGFEDQFQGSGHHPSVFKNATGSAQKTEITAVEWLNVELLISEAKIKLLQAEKQKLSLELKALKIESNN